MKESLDKVIMNGEDATHIIARVEYDSETNTCMHMNYKRQNAVFIPSAVVVGEEGDLLLGSAPGVGN